MPRNLALETELKSTKYIEKNFEYVVGHSSKVSKNCVWVIKILIFRNR